MLKDLIIYFKTIKESFSINIDRDYHTIECPLEDISKYFQFLETQVKCCKYDSFSNVLNIILDEKLIL